MSHIAFFWEKKQDAIHCLLCPHHCMIAPGKSGLCKTRRNKAGVLYAENYGNIASLALDPIEKKPLYHFFPGSFIISAGTYGCNMKCIFCQNYRISQETPQTQYYRPEDLIYLCKENKDNIGIAFTYNEPLMWYEYIYDTARAIKSKNSDMVVVLITNGFINPGPLKKLLPYIDAINLDLKSYKNETYRRLCGAGLNPVLETIKTVAASKCHLEITTLVITEENDSIQEIGDISKFIAGLNRDIPLHLSRYFPAYKLQNPATSLQTLRDGVAVAREHLNYVYVGNVLGFDASTYCPNCGEKVIERNHYQTKLRITASKCPKCGLKLPIVL